jgi:threonyl-tRNA synthetase
LERFFGVLVEHYEGAFPLWLAPIQALVLPVTPESYEYAREVMEELRCSGLRVELDARNEKIGYRIREAQLQKTPYMLVVGEREAQERKVAVRSRKEGELGALTVAEVAQRLNHEVAKRK